MVSMEEDKAGFPERVSSAPDHTADWDERVDQVMSALERLSDNQKEVIRLKFQQDLSYREISAATGLGTGNVGFLLHTGLKRLRALLPDDLLENSIRKS